MRTEDRIGKENRGGKEMIGVEEGKLTIYLPWVLCLSVCDCVCVSQLRNALLFF